MQGMSENNNHDLSTHHKRVGSSGATGATGQSGPGRVCRRRVCSRKTQSSLVTSIELKKNIFWTSSRKHEQEKSHLNRWGNKARDWQPVDNRFIIEMISVLCSWLLTNVSVLFISVNPYHTRHVREKTGGQAVDNHFIKGTRGDLYSRCWPVERPILESVKYFYARHGK